jgi:hypothetical protein
MHFLDSIFWLVAGVRVAGIRYVASDTRPYCSQVSPSRYILGLLSTAFRS